MWKGLRSRTGCDVPNKIPTVNADDLVDAMQWVYDTSSDNQAYVCRETGKIYWVPGEQGLFDEPEEDVPDDIHEQGKYLALPGKYDLDLGNQLAYDFAREFLPEHYDRVRDIFRRQGAYGRFKDFLAGEDVLEEWHEYSDRREVDALLEWGEANGIEVERPERLKSRVP